MSQPGRFIVRCRVSGGVTGTREAILNHDGVITRFATRAQAEAKAKALCDRMNHAYSVAYFEYWADEEQAS